MSCLHVCPSCARHVRSVETTCPFCDADLPEDFGVCGEPRVAGRPLSRAALLLMSATALGACGKSQGGGAAIYGPAPVDARPDSGVKASDPEPIAAPVAVYGPAPVADTDAAPEIVAPKKK